MSIRTSVTCNRCSHQWRTKAKNPDEAKCPKCSSAERGQRPITPAQAAKAVKQVISMRPARGVLISDGPSYAAERQVAEKFRFTRPAPAPRDTRRTQQAKAAAVEDKGKKNFAYNQTHATEFVRLLCCWTFTDPPSAAYRRDKNDYRSALLNLIEVNKTRTDAVGIWESAAAHAEIAALR